MTALMKPRKLIDPSQEWFYTKEWQKNEHDADKDIQEQNLSPVFSSPEEGLRWLGTIFSTDSIC